MDDGRKGGKRRILHSPKLCVRSLTPGCSCRGSGSQEPPVQEGCMPLVSCGQRTEDRGQRTEADDGFSLSECWLSRATFQH